jgi:hypothetical protein
MDKATHAHITTVQSGEYQSFLRIQQCRESPLIGSSRCNYVDTKVVGFVATQAMAIAAMEAHAKENNLQILSVPVEREEHHEVQGTHVFCSPIYEGQFKGRMQIVACDYAGVAGTMLRSQENLRIVGIVDTYVMAYAARDAYAKQFNISVTL